jgi:hypothetical protein
MVPQVNEQSQTRENSRKDTGTQACPEGIQSNAVSGIKRRAKNKYNQVYQPSDRAKRYETRDMQG